MRNKEEERRKQKLINVNYQPKQIAEIEAPFARYPMPNLKTISVNPIDKPKYTSLPPMNTNYRPQRKQYAPSEVKKYMTSTVDLSQPDFTYWRINEPHKHSEYIRMQQMYDADKKFSEKYAKAVHDFNKKHKLEQLKESRKARRNSTMREDHVGALMKDSLYPLPDVKHLDRKHFKRKADFENQVRTSVDTLKTGRALVPNVRKGQYSTVKDPSIFNVKQALKSL